LVARSFDFLRFLSTSDPRTLVVGATLSLVGIGIAQLAGRRRWEDDYDELARSQRIAFWLVYGRPLGAAVICLILAAGLAVRVLMAANNPTDPWFVDIRPRGWGCIFKTGDVVGCSRAAAKADPPSLSRR